LLGAGLISIGRRCYASTGWQRGICSLARLATPSPAASFLPSRLLSPTLTPRHCSRVLDAQTWVHDGVSEPLRNTDHARICLEAAPSSPASLSPLPDTLPAHAAGDTRSGGAPRRAIRPEVEPPTPCRCSHGHCLTQVGGGRYDTLGEILGFGRVQARFPPFSFLGPCASSPPFNAFQCRAATVATAT
jgi:hypothetical protein